MFNPDVVVKDGDADDGDNTAVEAAAAADGDVAAVFALRLAGIFAASGAPAGDAFVLASPWSPIASKGGPATKETLRGDAAVFATTFKYAMRSIQSYEP